MEKENHVNEILTYASNVNVNLLGENTSTLKISLNFSYIPAKKLG